jgi:hypothetical protein
MYEVEADFSFAPVNWDLCTVRPSDHRPAFPPSATRPLRILQRLHELVVKLEVNSWMVPCAVVVMSGGASGREPAWR